MKYYNNGIKKVNGYLHKHLGGRECVYKKQREPIPREITGVNYREAQLEAQGGEPLEGWNSNSGFGLCM